MKLHEIRMLTGIHPTENQKKVLAKIIASPSPKVAGEEIIGDENLVAARNILMKLGVVTFSGGNAELTDKGKQIAQDENIADEGGQLTDAGNILAYGEEGAPGQQPSQPELGMPPPAPLGGELGGGPLGVESFLLLRDLIK